jgi:FkbM family methyltransferase
MNRNLFTRIMGLGEDILKSLHGSGLPLRRVFDREYVAAWHQFHNFKPNSVQTLIDIGAHKGLYTSRAARYFQLKRAILIEPLPKLAAHLRKLRIPGVEVVEAAMSDNVDNAIFMVSKVEQASSLLEMNPSMSDAYSLDMSETEKITVRVTTLDQTVSDLNIQSIDLLKIDVQGSERDLLAGAKNTLKKIKFVQVEVLFVEHYHGCAQFFEIHSIMKRAGFRLCRLVDFSHDSTGALLQADAIYQNVKHCRPS